MDNINMAAELFVRAQREISLLSDAEAEAMKMAILSARDIDKVMAELNKEVFPKFKRALRFNELLEILHELQERPFMAPAAIDLYLKQGSTCEELRDFAKAIDYYTKGLAAYATMAEPDPVRGYWLFNNSAFCHNYEQRFPEAQRLAEKAISIERETHNAWKNRGVSLEHQEERVEAAACYMAAYIKCGGGDDPRPMMHLKRIFRRHDGLRDDLARQAAKRIGSIFSGAYKTFCLAETYYHCGHLDRAAREYKKFFAIAPYGYASHLKYADGKLKELGELKKIEAQFK